MMFLKGPFCLGSTEPSAGSVLTSSPHCPKLVCGVEGAMAACACTSWCTWLHLWALFLWLGYRKVTRNQKDSRKLLGFGSLAKQFVYCTSHFCRTHARLRQLSSSDAPCNANFIDVDSELGHYWSFGEDYFQFQWPVAF